MKCVPVAHFSLIFQACDESRREGGGLAYLGLARYQDTKIPGLLDDGEVMS